MKYAPVTSAMAFLLVFPSFLSEALAADTVSHESIVRELRTTVLAMGGNPLSFKNRLVSPAAGDELAGEMLLISGGSFHMGDLSRGNPKKEYPSYSVTAPDFRMDQYEKPVRKVTVSPFKLGKHEVTFSQWDACVVDGGCDGYSPNDEKMGSNDRGGRGNHPVVNVSWNDAQRFINWLNAKTDGEYRLPTEAEWEYTARAGTETAYPWGNDVGDNQANCNYCGDKWPVNSLPVGSFPANGWGLHDMHGNVAEWVQDCWNESYAGAPGDGSAWTSGDCAQRVIRGGSWYNKPRHIRSASRAQAPRSFRADILGFRLAQDL